MQQFVQAFGIGLLLCQIVGLIKALYVSFDDIDLAVWVADGSQVCFEGSVAGIRNVSLLLVVLPEFGRPESSRGEGKCGVHIVGMFRTAG